MAFGTSWKSIVEDAGWGAAALLTVLALVALLVFAVKGRYRSSQARAARALLGARNDQIRRPWAAVPARPVIFQASRRSNQLWRLVPRFHV